MSFKKLAKNIAKIGGGTLATALATTGPIGAMAGGMLAKTLGIAEDDKDFAEKVAQAASTDDGKAKILELNLQYETRQKEIEAEVRAADQFQRRALYESDERDRASARNYTPQDKSRTILSYGSMIAFAILLGSLLWWEIPPGNENLLYGVIGAISGYMSAIVSFNFGSSAGSKDKTDLMDKMLKEAADELE